MKRMQVLIGALGLVMTAAVVSADVPKEATILGQKYALEVHSLGGKYANGLSVQLADDPNQSAQIQFVQGETPEKDRLFVVATPPPTQGLTAHQFYLLTGANANGVFNQSTSNLTEFFGGAVDWERGGRPSAVTFISDVDTGKKKDRNIALTTFSNDDYLRFYDLDTLTGDYVGDSILNKIQRSFSPDEPDEGMPFSGFIMGALGPNGTVIFAGRGEGEGPQLGVMDATKDRFFNVLTQLATATENAKTPIDPADDAQDFERLSNNEYLLLAAQPTGFGDKNLETLYHLRLTLPADLSTAEPGSIKVEVLGAEQLINAEEGKDRLGTGPAGVIGMAVGRPVADGGPRRLYFTTIDGRLITAHPVGATAGS